MPKLINGLPPRLVITKAADAGYDPFWAAVVRSLKNQGYNFIYGDLPPDAVDDLEQAMYKAVEIWAKTNIDSLKESTDTTEIVTKNDEDINEIVKCTHYAIKSLDSFLAEAGGETGWVVQVHKTPTDKAIPVVSKIMEKKHRVLEHEIPDFADNYEMLRAAVKKSWGVARKDMPVINADQIDQFARALREGALDILKPFAKGKMLTAADVMKLSDPEEYVTLGLKDQNHNDDKLVAKMKMVAAKDLKPIQEQIYLDKMADMIAKFGPVKPGNPVTKLTMITSADNYIIDGHHRWGVTMMSDPTVKLQVLQVPLKIDDLLKVTLAYGFSIGNKPNV